MTRQARSVQRKSTNLSLDDLSRHHDQIDGVLDMLFQGF
jgi:hypothetical protein